jgi:hypothetical protein
VVQLPDEAFQMSRDGRRATLQARNVSVLDTFQFGGSNAVPATVSFTVRWEATGRRQARGKGVTVPPTDPAAFLAQFADARSTASLSGSELGFSFRSDPGTNTDHTFAELGPERNGIFLR